MLPSTPGDSSPPSSVPRKFVEWSREVALLKLEAAHGPPGTLLMQILSQQVWVGPTIVAGSQVRLVL